MNTSISARLAQQMQFINEVEHLKMVARRNRVVDGSRFENSAEHSWHIALMAMVLAEHADTPTLDVFRAIKMLLLHDLVEIDAGDTWIFDADATASQSDREAQAAERIFGLLPSDQAAEFHALHSEFESRNTPESQFAAAIDALQPLTNHLLSGRIEEGEIPPSASDVTDRKARIADSSDSLWTVALDTIRASTEKGLYRRHDDTEIKR
jgi:putative hydrolases of HD superfamily